MENCIISTIFFCDYQSGTKKVAEIQDYCSLCLFIDFIDFIDRNVKRRLIFWFKIRYKLLNLNIIALSV